MNRTQAQAHSHYKKSLSIATKRSFSVCSRLKNGKARIRRPWPINLCGHRGTDLVVCSSIVDRELLKLNRNLHEERKDYSIRFIVRNTESFFQSKEGKVSR